MLKINVKFFFKNRQKIPLKIFFSNHFEFLKLIKLRKLLKDKYLRLKIDFFYLNTN